MTRKRFVKLMMSRGYSRNEAKEVALSVMQSGKSYAEVYLNISSLYELPESMTVLSERINMAVNVICEGMRKLANAFAEGATAFVDAFNKSL